MCFVCVSVCLSVCQRAVPIQQRRAETCTGQSRMPTIRFLHARANSGRHEPAWDSADRDAALGAVLSEEPPRQTAPPRLFCGFRRQGRTPRRRHQPAKVLADGGAAPGAVLLEEPTRQTTHLGLLCQPQRRTTKRASVIQEKIAASCSWDLPSKIEVQSKHTDIRCSEADAL